jgi:glycosyltransferase involved in cell wall biosynthesis
MKRKHILYLTTNTTWGGSEILWTQSAGKFIEKGFFVKAGAYYDFELLRQSLSGKEQYIDLRSRFALPGMALRAISKVRKKEYAPEDLLKELVNKHKPDLAIISQGNNKDGLGLMQFCYDHDIPFVNIIQLVAECHWPGLDDKKIDQLNLLFSKAIVNYFVSRHTLQMHEKILGVKLSNAQFIYNPFTKEVPDSVKFPVNRDGTYKVALIGRLENFHKGYDLLIDVVKQEKWRERNIVFSIFGSGPHLQLLKRTIQLQRIKNIVVHEHVENIAAIWKDHHILMMPSRMEGQSLTLIEAMWFKRAAIVTNVGGVEELIEDGKSGFIAEYPAEKFIDIAMERAWAARDYWEHMGITAYEHILEKHPKDAVLYFNKQIEQLLS